MSKWRCIQFYFVNSKGIVKSNKLKGIDAHLNICVVFCHHVQKFRNQTNKWKETWLRIGKLTGNLFCWRALPRRTGSLKKHPLISWANQIRSLFLITRASYGLRRYLCARSVLKPEYRTLYNNGFCLELGRNSYIIFHINISHSPH